MDTSQIKSGVTSSGISYSADELVIKVAPGREIAIYPLAMAYFERVCSLWQAAIRAVLAEGGESWTFISAWQNCSLYRDNFREILMLLGIQEPEATLSPKQISDLLSYCEEVKQPLIFLLHDVGVPTVKKNPD